MAISSSTSRAISLFCRAALTISAIVVLGITAWAVVSAKTVTVIYSLVVACLTLFFIILLLVLSFASHRKPISHVISSVTELVLAFLWIAAFVLLANNFNGTGCRINRWHGLVVCSRQYTVEAFSFIAFFFALLAAIFSFLTVYAMAKEGREHEQPHREKAATPSTVAETVPETIPETHAYV